MGDATSIAPTNAAPEVGITRVVSIPAVVVLPAPFGPSRPKISPPRTLRLSASTAAKSVPALDRGSTRPCGSPRASRSPPASAGGGRRAPVLDCVARVPSLPNLLRSRYHQATLNGGHRQDRQELRALSHRRSRRTIRENPTHTAYGISLAHSSTWSSLGRIESEEILPGITIHADSGVTGNFRSPVRRRARRGVGGGGGGGGRGGRDAGGAEWRPSRRAPRSPFEQRSSGARSILDRRAATPCGVRPQPTASILTAGHRRRSAASRPVQVDAGDLGMTRLRRIPELEHRDWVGHVIRVRPECRRAAHGRAAAPCARARVGGKLGRDEPDERLGARMVRSWGIPHHRPRLGHRQRAALYDAAGSPRRQRGDHGGAPRAPICARSRRC